MGRPGRRFTPALVFLSGVALALRLTYVAVAKDSTLSVGDQTYYYLQAKLLVAGEFFVNPFAAIFLDVQKPAGEHGPLVTVFLAAFDLLGADSVFRQRLALAALGAVTVVLTGLVGYRVAGSRTGLLAAGIMAVYPNVWAWDGLLLSESLTLLLVVAAMLLAYRVADRPTIISVVVLGAVCGLATLSRSEMLLLAPMLLIPLLARRRTLTLWRRVGLLGVAAAVILAVLSPWVIRNLVVFERPVFISTGYDIILENANCDSTYYGDLLGWWDLGCQSSEGAKVDQSVQAQRVRERALDYIGDHAGRVPVVVVARLGRMLDVYRPLQNVRLTEHDGREAIVGWAGLAFYYPLVVAAACGAAVLRRRATPISPLIGPIAVVALVAVFASGNTRYRVPAEGSIVVLAAVAIDSALGWWARRRAARPKASASFLEE
ncbi:MAG: ArnT family glycosyltransferase [Acidimicrobiia bacterium]